MTYGERFRVVRKARWKGTVLALAAKFGSKYPSTIYGIERYWRVPPIPTILDHAKLLGCEPWELLEDVETEFDQLRALGKLPADKADRELTTLLRRYKESTKRGSNPSKETDVALPASARFHRGAALKGGRSKARA